MLSPRLLGRCVALCLLGTLFGPPGAALAQEAPFDPAIDVQTFEYAVGPKTFVTVSDADVAARQQLAVDALVTFLSRPFTIYDLDDDKMISGERVRVVESLTAAQFAAAYGVSDRFQLGASLPVIFNLSGEGLEPNSGAPAMGGLQVTGIGDLIIEGKYRLYRQNGLKVAALAAVSLPSSIGSDGSQFIGDDLPTLRARLAVQLERGRLSLGANAGALLRKPRTIYDSTIGPQLAWSAAAAIRVASRASLIAEGYGRAGLPDFSLDASPLEALGGVRINATGAVAVLIGGGTGLVRGIGSPAWRAFLSLGYAPDVRDSDKDGIPNGRDRCPLQPEDRDGTEDGDGCPEDDNDGDRRPDAEDKCPDRAEDIDGFDDDDGCPEPDNDKDGLPDLSDKCPNDAEDGKQPNATDGCPANKRDSDGDGVDDAADACPTQEEDMDGFDDGDGCPELDNDADGVPDAADRCALCSEDADQYQDEDGCPELDNDKDGILDTQDSCPLEVETINGVKDDDGCPDAGAPIVQLDGDRLIISRVPALARAGLAPAGTVIVDQIARVLLAHPEVTKWLIALAQPKAADATRLAEAIAARLQAKGVPEDRISVLGAAGAAKIGGVVQERGEMPIPACPAGREAKPREAAGAATPAPATPAPAAPTSAAPAPATPAPAAPASAAPAPAPAKPAPAKPAASRPAKPAAPKPAQPKPPEPEPEIEIE